MTFNPKVVSTTNVEFRVCKNVQLETIQLAKQLSFDSIGDHGCFRIAISGGSFCKKFGNGLKQLTKANENNIDFKKWRIFWADERCVKLDENDSNYKSFVDDFLSKAKDIPSSSIFAINDKLLNNINKSYDMNRACEAISADYNERICKEFNIDCISAKNQSSNWPKFDCIFLGMGGDGHCASLFPNHSLLKSVDSCVDFLSDSPKDPPFRITLTLPVLCNSRNIIFLVTGEAKQTAVSEIVQNSKSKIDQVLPAGIVTQKSKGNVFWMLDKTASGKL